MSIKQSVSFALPADNRKSSDSAGRDLGKNFHTRNVGEIFWGDVWAFCWGKFPGGLIFHVRDDWGNCLYVCTVQIHM